MDRRKNLKGPNKKLGTLTARSGIQGQENNIFEHVVKRVPLIIVINVFNGFEDKLI